MNKRHAILICGDGILAYLALYAGYALRFWSVDGAYASAGWRLEQLPVFILVLLFSSFLVELYNLERHSSAKEIVVRLSLGILVAFIMLSTVYYVIPQVSVGRGMFGISLSLFGVLQALWHLIYEKILNYEGFASKVLVLGTGQMAQKIGNIITATNHNNVLRGYLRCSDEAVCVPQQAIVGSGDRLFEAVHRERVQKVVISLSERRGTLPVSDMLNCKFNGVQIIDAPSFYEELTGKLLLENVRPSWFIFSNGFQTTMAKRVVKRIMDIVLSLLVGVATLPFMPLITLVVKLDSKGPVFFRQVRVGERDRQFTLFKFRTMRQDAESSTGAVWAQKNDNRVTRIGKILRKIRLDELPQLYNVLKGDMSFIGPRPERPEFVAKLKEVIPYYSERHHVKPGLTGWAQIKYPYGASVEDAIEKLRYDLYYIKNLSLFLDLLIILETTKVVLFGRGGR